MPSSWRAAALTLATLVPLSAGLPLNIPQRPAGPVTDLAGLLSPEQRRTIEGRLAAFERETTHSVAVLIIPSLEGHSLEEVSHQVGVTWKLGRKELYNGVLLLIAVRDRRARIEVGYGLEPSLPDGLAGAIIRDAVAPHFRQSDFAGGINAGLDRIFAATRNADLSAVPARQAAEAQRAWGSRLAFYVLLTLGLIGLAHFAAHQFIGAGYWTLFGGSGAGLAAGIVGFSLPWRFFLGWAGLGVGLAVLQILVEEYYQCPKCGGWLRRHVSPALGSAVAPQEVVISFCPRCQFQSRGVSPARTWVESATGAGTGFWIGSVGPDFDRSYRHAWEISHNDA